jgi:hypothetical protein
VHGYEHHTIYTVCQTLCVCCGPLVTECRLHADVLNSCVSEQYQLHCPCIFRHLLLSVTSQASCTWFRNVTVCAVSASRVTVRGDGSYNDNVFRLTKANAETVAHFRDSRCSLSPFFSGSTVARRPAVEGKEVR